MMPSTRCADCSNWARRALLMRGSTRSNWRSRAPQMRFSRKASGSGRPWAMASLTRFKARMSSASV